MAYLTTITKEELDSTQEKAEDAINTANGEGRFAEYETGVNDALIWVLGLTDQDPMEES